MYGSNLKVDELQFGYTKDSSTELATWTLIQTIMHYKKHNTNAFILFADCSKAYERILHSRMFGLLRERKVHPLLCRILITSYRQQKAFMMWQGEKSFKFPILNWVRQGAVSSPIFFNLYTQEIFEALRNAGYDALICGSFCGIFEAMQTIYV